MNIKLIVQELESYESVASAQRIRDLYMADNVLSFLGHRKSNDKAVVWAHNGHIANTDATEKPKSMGSNLKDFLHDQYYAIGFEFYSGSFQTRNADNSKKNVEVMTVGEPPFESLPWYFDQVGKEKFFIDFRNTGTERIKNFSQPYQMHLLGASYGTQWPSTQSVSLKDFDGMIYIKQSTAAKNLTKVNLDGLN